MFIGYVNKVIAHGPSLRFSNRPSIFKCRTECFKKSFFPNHVSPSSQFLVNSYFYILCNYLYLKQLFKAQPHFQRFSSLTFNFLHFLFFAIVIFSQSL